MNNLGPLGRWAFTELTEAYQFAEMISCGGAACAKFSLDTFLQAH